MTRFFVWSLDSQMDHLSLLGYDSGDRGESSMRSMAYRMGPMACSSPSSIHSKHSSSSERNPIPIQPRRKDPRHLHRSTHLHTILRLDCNRCFSHLVKRAITPLYYSRLRTISLSLCLLIHLLLGLTPSFLSDRLIAF